MREKTKFILKLFPEYNQKSIIEFGKYIRKIPFYGIPKSPFHFLYKAFQTSSKTGINTDKENINGMTTENLH